MFNLAPWVLFALLSAIFAALTAIFAKAGLKNVDSDLATAIRTAFVLLLTWGIVFYKGASTQIHSLSKTNWVFLILSAMATGLSWLFYFRALQLGKVAAVSAIDKGSLMFTILLAFVFLKEPLTAKMLVGILLIFIGILVLVLWK
jgi:bacterial/archaeal transporter family protein